MVMTRQWVLFHSLLGEKGFAKKTTLGENSRGANWKQRSEGAIEAQSSPD